jgi:hypothetical protein
MSSQSPVVSWYREVNYEVVGMYVAAVPVLGAESVDFLFNWGDEWINSKNYYNSVAYTETPHFDLALPWSV